MVKEKSKKQKCLLKPVQSGTDVPQMSHPSPGAMLAFESLKLINIQR